MMHVILLLLQNFQEDKTRAWHIIATKITCENNKMYLWKVVKQNYWKHKTGRHAIITRLARRCCCSSHHVVRRGGVHCSHQATMVIIVWKSGEASYNYYYTTAFPTVLLGWSDQYLATTTTPVGVPQTDDYMWLCVPSTAALLLLRSTVFGVLWWLISIRISRQRMIKSPPCC
jgi:hypothetical protein